MGELKEKCAVVGGSTGNSEVDAVDAVFLGLEVQQHRGDDSSGIASLSCGGTYECFTGPGLVRDVYAPDDLSRLAGMVAIGHNRYPTSGGYGNHNQPVNVSELRLALGHNGSLSETSALQRRLRRGNLDWRKLNDTEMLTHGIAQEIRAGKDAPDAIATIYPFLKGAFSCVTLHGDMVVAFRDPQGIRPLSLGAIEDGHMVSSETCGLYPSRAKFLGDVKPGEMVIMTKGDIERHQLADPNPKLDIFEIVYFCSPDSELFGESVGEMRYRLGQELAEQYPLEGDYLVVAAPDSAKPIAEGYAYALKMEERGIIIKNRFRGGRSFQQPTQAARQKFLERKFTYINGPARNRDVILIDDSVVRLNTAQALYGLLKRAGARTVSILSGSPPIGYPDFSGIDTPNQDELIAANHTPEEIRRMIGKDCKFFGYLALSRMVHATGQPASVFNLASFNGEYPYDIGKRRKNIREPVSLGYLEESA